MEDNPHQVLEGMLLAGYAIGAEKGYFYIRGEYSRSIEVIKEAIDEARCAGFIGHNICGIGFNFDPTNPSDEGITQQMSIFSAYYLPGTEKNLSNNVITPVNTFRIIFNSYFNTDYELLENKMYLIDDDDPDYFTDVTNILISP